MADNRISCQVPFCRRTTAERETMRLLDGTALAMTEWLCQRHWSSIRGRLRRLHSGSKRRLRKERSMAAYQKSRRIWARVVREAIETTAGIR